MGRYGTRKDESVLARVHIDGGVYEVDEIIPINVDHEMKKLESKIETMLKRKFDLL